MALSTLTYLADLLEMSVSLWLAFYLFSRGIPNKITLRITLSLFAIAVFFLGAYNNHFNPVEGTASLRASLLVIGMGCWQSVIFSLRGHQKSKWIRWLEPGIYLLCMITILSLISDQGAFIDESNPTEYAKPMANGLTQIIYGGTLLFVSVSMALTSLMNWRGQKTTENKYFFIISSLPLITTIYRFIAEFTNLSIMPRILQDGFFFAGVLIMSLAVGSFQSMTERRTILEELPLTLFGVSLLSIGFGSLFLLAGYPIADLGNLTVGIVGSLGVYDIIREFLDRQRTERKNQFRRSLILNEKGTENINQLQNMLQTSLETLCLTMDTSSGIVTISNGAKNIVLAAKNSVEVGSELPLEENQNEGILLKEGVIQSIAWISPIFEAQKQIALVGVGRPNAKSNFSSGDLELLGEFSDYVGILVSLSNLVNRNLRQSEEANNANNELRAFTDGILRDTENSLEQELTPFVEDALRRFSDLTALGQSPLVEFTQIQANNHIDRGKMLSHILREGVEALRPSTNRPSEMIPRVWYPYIILHDAYIEGKLNRDIMATLYISEGTFNRTRRSAIRGIARWLREKFRQNSQVLYR